MKTGYLKHPQKPAPLLAGPEPVKGVNLTDRSRVDLTSFPSKVKPSKELETHKEIQTIFKPDGFMITLPKHLQPTDPDPDLQRQAARDNRVRYLAGRRRPGQKMAAASRLSQQ